MSPVLPAEPPLGLTPPLPPGLEPRPRDDLPYDESPPDDEAEQPPRPSWDPPPLPNVPPPIPPGGQGDGRP
jgi:phospholipid/cholesterol/gamma-HCH transport system substrate-binding protein